MHHLMAARVPNFRGKTVRDVIQESAALGIPIEFTGSGIARAQIPEPGEFCRWGKAFGSSSAASEPHPEWGEARAALSTDWGKR